MIPGGSHASYRALLPSNRSTPDRYETVAAAQFLTPTQVGDVTHEHALTTIKQGGGQSMSPLLREIRRTPLLWMLIFVPAALIAARVVPTAHTLLFVLAVLAIVPLAALLSHATESVSEKTGDAVGGLLNATLGNLTELIIAVTALRAGEHMLVKASIAGAIVTNSLFMLGASFFLGGMRYHVQEYNRVSARLQAGLLFLATIALLIPSAISKVDSAAATAILGKLSVGL